MVRRLLGFLAATPEELRQFRRAVTAATAGGIAIALLLPIVNRLLPSKEELLNILVNRRTVFLKEPLVKKLVVVVKRRQAEQPFKG